MPPPDPNVPASNPFSDFLGKAGEFAVDAAGKLVQVPIRAIQLPFQILSEAVGTPEARRGQLALEQQAQLKGKVTGQEIPFSKSKQYANWLSLGLIPGNQGTRLDASNLPPDQQGRFNQLSDLQQRIVQARTPADFADLLADPTAFESRKPQSAFGKSLADENAGLVPPGTGEALARQPIDPGQALFNPLNPNEPPIIPNPARQSTVFDDPGFLQSSLKLFTPASVEEARRADNIGMLLANPKEEDVTKFFESKSKEATTVGGLRTAYLALTKPYRELGNQYRTFLGSYGQKSEEIPEDIASALQAAGRDLSKLDASGIRDIAFVFQFMKALDPQSTVRESEGRLVVTATSIPQALRAKLEKAINGNFLDPEVRNEIFYAITDVMRTNLKGYDIATQQFGASGARLGVNPDDVTLGGALIGDVQSAIEALEGARGGTPSQGDPKQAYLSSGGDPKDPTAFKRWLIDNGYSLKGGSGNGK